MTIIAAVAYKEMENSNINHDPI